MKVYEILTNVPALQSSHVDIPVHPEQHHHSEYDHTKHSQETHHNPIYEVEEEEPVGQHLVERSLYRENNREHNAVTVCGRMDWVQ